MNSPALIPFDCGDEEIVFMVQKALHNLRGLADEIFEQANARMNECQSRLDSYKSRLRVMDQKFESMQKSNEVPLITSPAEFPGKIHLSRPLAFHHITNTVKQDSTRHEHPFKPLSIKEMVLRKNGYRFIFPKGKYNELLAPKKSNNNELNKKRFIRPEDFYNIKLTSNNDILFSSNSDFATNSLLIYDNMKAIDSTDPFTYKPGMANLTEFDLPDVLIKSSAYEGISKNSKKESMFGEDSEDEENDIFGEVTKRPLDVDFSARSSFYMPDDSFSRRSTISKIPTKPLDTPIISPSPQKLTPIVNEQPIVQVPTISQPLEQVQAPPPMAPSKNIPVPPPPPQISLIASIPSPPMPGRSDLMQAIRLAGGANKAGLKKTENEEIVEKKKPAPKVVDSSGDLMGSLAKALERRRKGISGKTAKKFEALEKPQKSTGNSTLSSLRELIPPPIKDSDSESGNEDDWK